MIGVVGAIAPIFLLIVAGYVFKRRGFPGDAFWAPAERLSYFVLLPALIVHTLAGADLAGIRIGALAAVLGKSQEAGDAPVAETPGAETPAAETPGAAAAPEAS